MADNSNDLAGYLPADILGRYEVRSYRNAAQLLATSAPAEHADLMAALRGFSPTQADIRKPGGNESDMPKRLASTLRPLGWQETRIKGDLHITRLTGKPPPKRGGDEDPDGEFETADPGQLRREGLPVEQIVRRNFLDGHKVDFIKGRVAFDVEWNSKDQTFDRDLYAFRAFYECDLIDLAVLLTRSADLNEVFDRMGAELDKDGNPKLDKDGRPKMLKTKYGASTTWMGKLAYRLDAGRQGGCPVLALGITRRVITDWSE